MHELNAEFDLVCDKLYLKLEELKLNELIEKVKKLQSNFQEIDSFADEYNFKNVKANGYWSILRIGAKFIHLLNDHLENLKDDKIDQSLCHFIDYALIAFDVLNVLRKDSLEASISNNNEPQLQASSLNYFVDLFNLLLSIDNEKIAAAYGKFCSFWLSTNARYATIFFVSFLSFLSSNPINGVKCLFNSHFRGLTFAELIKTADIPFVKKLRIMLDLPFCRTFLPVIFYGNTPSIRKEVYVSRQNEWCLSKNNEKVFRSSQSSPIFNKKKPIRCILFQSFPNDKMKNKLIIYCHGGGFITGSPESQEIFIRDWANKLDGIKILSIDYSLSPEAKFPVALQEILDVYLWLISDSKELIESLGDKPEQIVLVGDSAGGNLITALCLVLNDIRHIDSSYNIIMPKSMVCLYTPFNITLLLSPSMILASCDTLLSAGVMLSCFEAYLPDFEASYSSQSSLPLLTLKDFSNIKILEIIKKWLKIIKDLSSHPTTVPWYREDKKKLKKRVEKLYKTTCNPYISPLLYQDMNSLSNIDLHLIALHYDPFLDDNVEMAKKWKGLVTLDVLDQLQHGFLNLMPLVDEAKKANQLCIERILQSFE